jgi:hypothetical protein
MTIALDIGAHRVRSLRKQNGRLIGRSVRTAYADTPRHRRLLDGGRVGFATCDRQLVLIGDDAVDYARVFREPVQAALPGGKLPQESPLARQVLATIIGAVLPRADRRDEVCCLTLPGGTTSSQPAAEFLTRLLKLAGYAPVVTRAGLGLILAELSHTSFTGAAVCLGAATCELTVAHRGREIATVSVCRGGDWIDAQLAEQEGCFTWDSGGRRLLDVDAIACWKAQQNEPLALTSPSPLMRTLAGLYRTLLDELCAEAARVFERTPLVATLQRPLPLAVAGGAAQIPGFGALLDEQLRGSPLPPFGPARVVYDTEYTIARGCLIRAELEAQPDAAADRAAA